MTNTASAPVRTAADLLELYRNDDRISRVAEGLREPAARVHIGGTLGSARALIASSITVKLGGTHVFVLNDREEAAYFLNDLQAFSAPHSPGEGPGGRALFYPAPSRSPYDPDGHHDAERVTRTEVLEVLMKHTAAPTPPGTQAVPLIIVTYPEALVPLVVTKEVMQKNTLAIKRSEELPIDTLEEWLHETGFSRVEFVYEPGQFSIRGGIVDIFSYGSDKPYRIELYGDAVESVRRFDPQDQLTVEFLKEAVIVPDLQEEDSDRQQNFFAQLPDDTTLWLQDLQAIGDAANERLKRLEEAYARLDEKDKHAAPAKLLATDSELVKGTLGFRKIFFRSDDQTIRRSENEGGKRSSDHLIISSSDQCVDFALKPQPAFAKEFKILSGDLHNKQNAGYTNLIACNSAKQSERLYSIFNDMEHEVAFTPLVLDLHEGFIDPS
jgi:transcription-repair coupling factor (superfamily II helicase)